MNTLIRFGISIEQDLLKRFDRFNRRKGFVNRSQGIRDLMRTILDEDRVQDDKAPALAVLTLVYDHHKRELEERLTTIQHDHHHSIISTTHVHIDHDNCLEVILLRGRAGALREIASDIASLKGIHHSKLQITSAEHVHP
ncbi:MAG TPA: nickel-responsive transcriptional regulator NikR [Bacteroidota bacterium]|nr:nickel-responsive transcriptional regulator NikR [Bacteroidota bacterium]